MKKYLKLTIIIVALATLCTALVACSDGEKEIKYDYLVTFKYNVGNIDAKCEDQFLGVKKDSPIGIQPGYSDNFKLAEITGYYVEGWYTAKVDEEGNPIVDSETNKVELDEKWDFEGEKKVNSNVTLYANILKKPTLSFVDRKDGTVVNVMVETPGTVRRQPSETTAPQKEGATFYGYYYANETGDEQFSWPYTFGTEDDVVYVEFIEGNWIIARDIKTFNTGIANNLNVYLDADLDFSGQKWNTRSFNGVINGNGHTISGISLEMEGNRFDNSNFGLFGTIREKAQIYDINIDAELSFKAMIQGTYTVGFFAWEVEEGAKLNNVKVSGTLTYDIVKSPVTEVNQFIGINGAKSEDITNCDYSGVTLVNSADNSQDE